MKFPKNSHFLPVFIVCLAASLSLPSCKGRDGVERTRDANGVEIVRNPIHPVKVNGRQVTLELEEEIVIDTENDAVAETGLSDILTFDADSKGNIYILTSKADPGFIFQFDPRGRFLRTFGRQGQGPGEIPSVALFSITADDELVITNFQRKALTVFSPDGDLIREMPISLNDRLTTLLPGGNSLVSVLDSDLTEDVVSKQTICLYDARFNHIKNLDEIQTVKLSDNKTDGVIKDMSWGISKNRIAIGNPSRDYEIPIYDFQGTLIHIVKKTYKRVPTSEDYKKKAAKFAGKRASFPDFLPPFRYLFSDEGGRIYVMTYETGEKSSEKMCDIFNPDGIFICRKSLPDEPGIILDLANARARNGRLYCLRGKEDGGEELVVYKMNWR